MPPISSLRLNVSRSEQVIVSIPTEDSANPSSNETAVLAGEASEFANRDTCLGWNANTKSSYTILK